MNKSKEESETVEELLKKYETFDCKSNLKTTKFSQLFGIKEQMDKNVPTIKTNDEFYSDLEIFNSASDSSPSVFDAINRTHTLFGKQYFEDILQHPTDNVAILKKRQENTRACSHLLNPSTSFESCLMEIRKIEYDLLWFWNEQDEIRTLYDIVYFKIPYIDQYLNSNQFVLSVFNFYNIYVAPFIAICSPIISFILPYLIMRLTTNVQIPVFRFFQLMKSFLFSFPLAGRSGYASIFTVGVWVLMYLQ